MIDVLLMHRFSWGMLFFAGLLGYTLGIVTVLFAAWWLWCRNPKSTST